MCDGPKVNVVEELSEFAGDWGGSCTCPDGQIYEVGDNNWKGCGQIACVGGVAGKCSEFKGPWSRRRDSWSAGSGAYGSEAPVRGRPAVLCPAAVKS